MKRRTVFALLISATASALVWVLSPWLTGHAEPWDADGLFYIGSLTVSGFVAGGLVPKPLWAHYFGAVVGQMVYELLFLNIGPLFLLGAVFLLGYSLIYLAAAALAARIRLSMA